MTFLTKLLQLIGPVFANWLLGLVGDFVKAWQDKQAAKKVTEDSQNAAEKYDDTSGSFGGPKP